MPWARKEGETILDGNAVGNLETEEWMAYRVYSGGKPWGWNPESAIPQWG